MFRHSPHGIEPVSERHLLQAIVDTVAALIVVLDRDGRIVDVNAHVERVTGYAADQLVGAAIWDVLHLPEEADEVRRVFGALPGGVVPPEHQSHWVTRRGERRLIRWTNAALRDDGGSILFVVGTGIDVTDQRAAEERARRLREEEAALRARDELLSFVAHDLGNYVASIGLLARSVARRLTRPGSADPGAAPDGTSLERGRERALADLRRTGEAVAQVERLIEQLLAAERRRVQDLELDRAPCRPRAVLIEAVSLLRSRAADRSIRLRTAASAGLPVIRVDRRQLLRVMTNLLTNAIKFSPEGSVVRAGAEAVDGDVRFTVTDRGPGIPAADQERIFQRFWQREPGRAGHGVGLASARHIVESHGGRLWVESDGRSGSSFRFTIPILPPLTSPPSGGAARTRTS